MKRIILVISALFIIVGLYYVTPYIERDSNFDRAIMAETPTELFEVSDLIVTAEILPNKKNILVEDELDGQSIVSFGYTLTRIKINNVFHGEIDKNELKLVEEYWIEGKFLFTDNHYKPLKEGNEYLLFLTKHSDSGSYPGTYYLTAFDKGKYPSKDTKGKTIDTFVEELTYRELEIDKKSNQDEYKKWYKEVLKTIKIDYKM